MLERQPKGMKKGIITSLVLLLFAGSVRSQLQPSDSLWEQKAVWTARQEELIVEHVRAFPEQTQLAFVFIENGTVSFSGVILENDTIRPVDNHQKVFEIGSISKVFTASLLTALVVEEKVRLDDPVNDQLPFALKNSIRPTFRQLANHTSGLPRMPSNFEAGVPFDPANPYRNYGPDLLEKYLTKQVELACQPGERSEYSNLGAGLLAFSLEKMTGLDYQQLLEKYIFSKHGMTASTTRRANLDSRLVRGLDQNGRETSNWDFSVLVGAGGILSTSEDLAKFALGQFDDSNRELKLTRMPTFEVNERLAVGLGWHIVKTASNTELYCHNGGTGGYSSSIVLDTHQANGMIILSNVSAFHPESPKIEQLCFSLLRTLDQSWK
jgi:CubicO group peptidase (beta-lactamase class C family)